MKAVAVKPETIRDLSDSELSIRIREGRAEYFAAREARWMSGRPSSVRELRRAIARMLTERRARELRTSARLGMVANRPLSVSGLRQTSHAAQIGLKRRVRMSAASAVKEGRPMQLAMEPRVVQKHLYLDERQAQRPNAWVDLVQKRLVDRVFLDVSRLRQSQIQRILTKLVRVVSRFHNVVDPVVIGPVPKPTIQLSEFCANHTVRMTPVTFDGYVERLTRYRAMYDNSSMTAGKGRPAKS